MDNLLDRINDKYKALDQNPDTYLQGLLYSKPVTYWDYIQVDTLLTLQKPRTNFSDELIFITYHQIIELTLKLVVHELKQITSGDVTDMHEISNKINRITRYTDLLSSSFSIMNKGMSADQYKQFRLSLAPASGFQSAQFRLMEIFSTDIDNLINERGKKQMPEGTQLKDKFNYVYWQEGGYDRVNNKKTLTLQHFETKYLDEFKRLASEMEHTNLYRQALKWKENGTITDEVIQSLRDYDRNFNVNFPMVHLETAHTYLGTGSLQTAATGGSHWEKYLHPMYQRRIFFPAFWNEDELRDWGKPKEIDNHQVSSTGSEQAGKGKEVAPGI